ncbi:MAG: hypothetical protein BWX93_01792 [Bacteroidetes bacterium ADurb.Bin139]|nr:MAG: hypothetical protein BWX93_01792 [Bacteroidetes bacterium ADurb.Bin139]
MYRPAGYEVGFADVFNVDLLVVVYEENGAFGGSDQFQYLVLAPVLVEAAFQVQAVGFVHYEGVECILWDVAVIAAPAKEVVNHPLFEGAGQLGLVNGPRGCILGYVPGDLSPLGKLGKQVHGHHTFSRSRAAFHHQDHLFVAAGLCSHRQRRFINPLLLVNHDELPVACRGLAVIVAVIMAVIVPTPSCQVATRAATRLVSHDEFPVAPDHGSDAVSQLFGGPQAAVFYAVEDVLVVPELDEFLNELPELDGI